MMITNELARRNNKKKKTIREVSQSTFCRFKIFQLFFFLKEIPKFLVLPRYKKENVTKKYFVDF